MPSLRRTGVQSWQKDPRAPDGDFDYQAARATCEAELHKKREVGQLLEEFDETSKEQDGQKLLSHDVLEVGAPRDETIALAQQDLNFLAALALPEIYIYAYPPIFIAIWQILQVAIKRAVGKDYLALGIPRGFSKTVVMKLYVLYCILFTDRKFILIVCNTQELADNFVSDVWDMLTSINIVSLFGDVRHGEVARDTLKQKKFKFRGRDIILAGAGAKTSLRGLNIKYVRPDVILMDDMQNREEAESMVESLKTLTWMMGTLLKAASPHRCLYIFVGNMYPFEGSILKKLKHNPAWLSFICGAILEDGESLWPELKPVEELLTELENDTAMGHPEIFYSEVMNDEEAGTRSGIDVSTVRGVSTRELPEFYEAGFVIIDPSLGEKKSDDIAIGAYLLYDGVPVLREVLVGKWTPEGVVRTGISLALKYNLPAVVVESIAYQKSLVFWFNFFIKHLGLQGLQALPITPAKRAKTSRIIAALKELVAGQIKLHEDVRSQVVHQIIHWNPLATHNKDDILDLLALARPVVIEHGNAIQMPIAALLEDVSVGAETAETLALAF